MRRDSRSKDLKLNLVHQTGKYLPQGRRQSKDSSLESLDTSSARKEVFLDNINKYLVNSGLKGARRDTSNNILKENKKPNKSNNVKTNGDKRRTLKQEFRNIRAQVLKTLTTH